MRGLLTEYGGVNCNLSSALEPKRKRFQSARHSVASRNSPYQFLFPRASLNPSYHHSTYWQLLLHVSTETVETWCLVSVITNSQVYSLRLLPDILSLCFLKVNHERVYFISLLIQDDCRLFKYIANSLPLHKQSGSS